MKKSLPVGNWRAASPMSWAVMASVLIGGHALPAQMVAWDVIGQNAAANSPFAATVLAGALSSASLTLGGGVSASATANTFGGSGFNQTSLAGAIGEADYLSFAVTPSAGTNFSLQSISLLFGVSSAVTNFNVALAANVSGFTSGDALWTYSFSTASPAAQTVTLSGFALLQDVDSPLEFRLYGWRDSAGTTTFRLRDNSGNDLSLVGSIAAIPEPAGYAGLLGAGGLAMAVWVRRKQRPAALFRRIDQR